MFRKKFLPENEKVEITINSISMGHHKVTYRGIQAIRCPFDYVIYQMIISELKPDLVIEIGTNLGGGALYLADLMDSISHGFVHTVDLTKQSDHLVAEHPRIKVFTGGWEKYEIEVSKEFEKILVIEDASHVYEDTLSAMQKFAPLVSVGSYLIVEDGIVNELGVGDEYNGGPLKAIREFLPLNKHFEVDRRWCDLFGKNATFNVNGYLKRLS